MTWGWRKILQLRPLIWQFIWYKVGNSNIISSWFDRWSSIIHLSEIISARDIHRANFTMTTKLSEIILDGQWSWPHDWFLKYPILSTINVPSITDSFDSVEWRHLGCIPHYDFQLWLVIKRKLKTQDNLRQWDVSSSLNSIVDYLIPISKRRSAREDEERDDVYASLEVARSSFDCHILMEFFFSCWLEDRSSLALVVYGSHLVCQLRVVLFFPSPGFFPLGFSWEDFLRRQDQLVFFSHDVQLLDSCGNLSSIR
ncbi:hypothetical protein Tco_1178172 [Tanacetum coccineum]